MHLDFQSSEIKQGNIESVIMRLNSEMVQQMELQKLVGSTLGESVYLYSAEPLIRRDSGDTFEAEGKVIFLKIPAARTLTHKVGDKEISLSWSEVNILPTEVPKGFIFGDFTVPARKQVLKWVILGLLVLIIMFGVLFYRKRNSQKQRLRQARLSLKEKIIAVNDYEQVVELWQQKADVLHIFPQLAEPFKHLEKTLFKYQFKASQTALEKDEVMIAYRSFLEESRRGLDGI
jgi:hypothetical protein